MRDLHKWILMVAAMWLSGSPMTASAQRIPAAGQASMAGVVRLEVVEERPHADAFAVIEVRAVGRATTMNTITIARKDLDIQGLWAAITVLNSFRDKYPSLSQDAVIPVRVKPTQAEMTTESQRYVLYYLQRVAQRTGRSSIVIPLRPVRGKTGLPRVHPDHR